MTALQVVSAVEWPRIVIADQVQADLPRTGHVRPHMVRIFVGAVTRHGRLADHLHRCSVTTPW
jgi:hypothetical protein